MCLSLEVIKILKIIQRETRDKKTICLEDLTANECALEVFKKYYREMNVKVESATIERRIRDSINLLLPRRGRGHSGLIKKNGSGLTKKGEQTLKELKMLVYDENDLEIDLGEKWREIIKNNEFKNLFEHCTTDISTQFGLKMNECEEIGYVVWLFGEKKVKTKSMNAKRRSIKYTSDGFEWQINIQLLEGRFFRPEPTLFKSFGRQPDLPSHDDGCDFHCTDKSKKLSILNRKPVIKIKSNGRIWRAYYNVSPYEIEGHFLWIPDIEIPEQRREHKLTQEDLLDMVVLIRKSNKMILLFNSLHAGARVNHIHFHGVYHKITMAIENAQTRLIKKLERVEIFLLEKYFVEGLVFKGNDDLHLATTIFAFIKVFQKQGFPFNLILFKDEIFLIPRNIEEERVEEFPNGILACFELCGEFILHEKAVFEDTNLSKINDAFEKISLKRNTIEELINQVNLLFI